MPLAVRAPALVSVLAALSVFLTPVPVRADRKPIPATFHMSTHGKLHVRTVVLAMERALSATQRLNYTPIRHLLEPVGPRLDRLVRSNELVARGRELMSNLEVQKAVEALQQAARLQRGVFDLLAGTESGILQHGQVYVELAMAQFLAGDEQKARKALQQAFVIVPKLEFDGQKLPPQMKRMFDEVRFLVDELGLGEAQIRTQPGGAQVRINGNFVGYSPLLSRGLAAGPNLVTVAKLGYRTRTVRMEVLGGGQPAELDVRLKPQEGAPSRLLANAVVEARARRPGPALAGLARRLERRMVFIGLSASRDDLVTVTLFAYDARDNRISSGAEATVSALDPEQECKDLAGSMVPFITWRPPPPVAKKRSGWLDRMQRSPYFWPVVGAAAGVVVVGATVGLGIYLGTRDDDNRGRNVLILPAYAR